VNSWKVKTMSYLKYSKNLILTQNTSLKYAANSNVYAQMNIIIIAIHHSMQIMYIIKIHRKLMLHKIIVSITIIIILPKIINNQEIL